MIVPVSDITNALNRINSFASVEKTVPGIMFDISDTGLKLCYSDSRKSIIETIDVTLEDGDVRGRIVFDYSKLTSILAACQPSGNVVIKEVQFTFCENNIVKVRAEKMIAISQAEEGEEPEYKVMSVFEQSIGWVEVTANKKVEILGRANYEAIFSDDVTDAWDIKELQYVLSALSVEKGRMMVISPSSNSAFVANIAYAGSLLIDPDADMAERAEKRRLLKEGINENPSGIKKYRYPITFNTGVSKSVSEILSKVNSSDGMIYVHTVINRVCYMFTEDRSFGMAVEMTEPNMTSINIIEAYRQRAFADYQLTVTREILDNVIKSAMNAGKMDKTALKFGKFSRDESQLAIKITSSDSGASTKNDYEVGCSGYTDREGNIESLELPISLKVFNDIMSLLSTDYVGIDINVDPDGAKYVRISDISIDTKFEVEGSIREELGLDNFTPLSMDEQIKLRDDYLTSRFYTISAK